MIDYGRSRSESSVIIVGSLGAGFGYQLFRVAASAFAAAILMAFMYPVCYGLQLFTGFPPRPSVALGIAAGLLGVAFLFLAAALKVAQKKSK